MILTYKVLSLLLDYPSGTLQESLPDIGRQLRKENYLDEASIAEIESFVDYAIPLSLTQWQEQYVTLFDQGKNTNLYLFDHVYGESRERGQAMADLQQMYTRSGFTPCADELPDFLPLYLEFIATQAETKSGEILLSDIKLILEKMRQQLEKQQTPYTQVMNIVYRLATTTSTASLVEAEKGVTT